MHKWMMHFPFRHYMNLCFTLLGLDFVRATSRELGRILKIPELIVLLVFILNRIFKTDAFKSLCLQLEVVNSSTYN